jgi:hypothetical protein
MKLLVLTVCAGLLAAGAASAQEGGVKSDARCVVAMAALYNVPAYKDGATASMFYYMGRMTGRDPQVDLTSALRREAQTMTDLEYLSEAQRCGGPVKARNEVLKTLGEVLQARAKR